jgi:hypothetical protein
MINREELRMWKKMREFGNVNNKAPFGGLGE